MRQALLSPLAPESEPPAVNLTPLIDVVFVILIAFIVIAPLLDVDSIALPPAAKTSDRTHFEAPGPIQIEVLKDNSLKLNKQTISLKALPSTLQQLKQLHPSTKPQLLHDRQAQFGTYQSVKNALEEAGFLELDVVLNPA